MRLTHEHIEAGRSDGGGWSKAQLALIGVAWPPPKGWKDKVVGMNVSDAVVAEFVRLAKRKEPA